MRKQETNPMEKQDTPTTYVRITKCSIGNAWYADNIGITFPIRGLSRKRGFYETIEGSQISDLDCEVVALPHQPDGFYKKTIEAAQEILADYIDPDGPGTEVTINKLLEILDNRKLIEKIRNEKHLPVLSEGQHLITEDLLKLTYKDLKANGLDFLVQAFETAFSAVFAPAKTYKIGQRMVMKGATKNIEMILTNVEYKRVGLVRLDDGTVWQRPVTVVDLNNITEEEMNHIKAGYDCFTLLPAEPTGTENFV